MILVTNQFTEETRRLNKSEQMDHFVASPIGDCGVTPMEEVTAVFQEVDINGDGLLSKEELEAKLADKSFYEKFVGMLENAGISQTSASSILKKMDTNEDGFVDMKELKEALRRSTIKPVPPMQWERQGYRGDPTTKPTDEKVVVKSFPGYGLITTADNAAAESKIEYCWSKIKEEWNSSAVETRTHDECTQKKQQKAFVPTDEKADRPGQKIFLHLLVTSPGKMCATYTMPKTMVTARAAKANVHAAEIDLDVQENSVVQYTWDKSIQKASAGAAGELKTYKTGEAIPIKNFKKGIHELHIKVKSRGILPIESVKRYYVNGLPKPSILQADIEIDKDARVYGKAPAGGGMVAEVRVTQPEAINLTCEELAKELDKHMTVEKRKSARKSMKNINFNRFQSSGPQDTRQDSGDDDADNAGHGDGDTVAAADDGDSLDGIDEDVFALASGKSKVIENQVENVGGYIDAPPDDSDGYLDVSKSATTGGTSSSGDEDSSGGGSIAETKFDGSLAQKQTNAEGAGGDNDEDEEQNSDDGTKEDLAEAGVVAFGDTAAPTETEKLALATADNPDLDPNVWLSAQQGVVEDTLVAAGDPGPANLFYYWGTTGQSQGFEFDDKGEPINDTFKVPEGGAVELDCTTEGDKTLYVKATKPGFADSELVEKTFTVKRLAEPSVTFDKAKGMIVIEPAKTFAGSGNIQNAKAGTVGRVLYSWKGPVDLGPSTSSGGSGWKEWRHENLPVPNDYCKTAGEQMLYLLSVQSGSVPVASKHAIKVETAILPEFNAMKEAGCDTVLGLAVTGTVFAKVKVQYAWSVSPSPPEHFDWDKTEQCDCSDPDNCPKNSADQDTDTHYHVWKPSQKTIAISRRQGSNGSSKATFYARAQQVGYAPLNIKEPYKIGVAETLDPEFNELAEEVLFKVPKDRKTKVFFSFTGKVGAGNKDVNECTDMYNGSAAPAAGDTFVKNYQTERANGRKIFKIQVPTNLFTSEGTLQLSYICVRKGVLDHSNIHEISIKPAPLPASTDYAFKAAEEQLVITTGERHSNVEYYYSWDMDENMKVNGSGTKFDGVRIPVDPTMLYEKGEKSIQIKTTQKGRSHSYGTYTFTVVDSATVTFVQRVDTGAVTFERDPESDASDDGKLFYSWDAKVPETFGYDDTPPEAVQQLQPRKDKKHLFEEIGMPKKHLLKPNTTEADFPTLYYKYIEKGKSPTCGEHKVTIIDSATVTFVQRVDTGAVTFERDPESDASDDGKLFYSWDAKVPETFGYDDTPPEAVQQLQPRKDKKHLFEEIGMPKKHLLKPNTTEADFPTLYYKYIEKGKSPTCGEHKVTIKSAIEDIAAFNARIIRHDDDTFHVGDINRFTFDVPMGEGAVLFATTGNPPSITNSAHNITSSQPPLTVNYEQSYDAVTLFWRMDMAHRAPSEGFQTWMQIPRISLSRGIKFTFPNRTLAGKEERNVQIKYTFAITNEEYEVGQRPEQWEWNDVVEHHVPKSLEDEQEEGGIWSREVTGKKDKVKRKLHQVELMPDGAAYSNAGLDGGSSVPQPLGTGWYVVPWTPKVQKVEQIESTALLKFGEADLPSKAELLKMGTTIRLWAACFIEGDDTANSFVSSFVKELRHIPDFLDLSLDQAFQRFDAKDSEAREDIVAKIESAKHGSHRLSTYERERQEAEADEEKKRVEKAERIAKSEKLAEKEGRSMTEEEKKGVKTAQQPTTEADPYAQFSWTALP